MVTGTRQLNNLSGLEFTPIHFLVYTYLCLQWWSLSLIIPPNSDQQYTLLYNYNNLILTVLYKHEFSTCILGGIIMKKISVSEHLRVDLEKIIEQILGTNPSPAVCRVLDFVREGSDMEPAKAAMIYWAIEDTIGKKSDVELYGEKSLAFEILYDKLEELLGVEAIRDINKPVHWSLQVDNLLSRFSDS